MMIQIKPLEALNPEDLSRLITGYRSPSKYRVVKTESEGKTIFSLELIFLPRPYIKNYDPVNLETIDFYHGLLPLGYSFGAYQTQTQELVGLTLCEPHLWNKSLHVLELHVAERFWGRGIGQQLMAVIEEKARTNGMRILVCETQNTNLPALNFYRKLGFEIDGIDLSYYSNDDYPFGEIALFMKKKLA